MELDIKALKVGDEVGMISSFSNRAKICKVEKTTATQVVVDGKRFNHNNRCIGENCSTYYRSYLISAQDAHQRNAYEDAEQHRKAMAEELSAHRWRNMSIEELQPFWDLLKLHNAKLATEATEGAE